MIKLFDFISGTRLRKQNVYFQYSTEEQFTGEYWIDGKKIYQKVVTWTGDISRTAHGITNLDMVTDYRVIAKSGVDSYYYSFPKVYYSNGSAGTFYDTDFFIDNTNIRCANNTSYAGYIFYCVIKYTKK